MIQCRRLAYAALTTGRLDEMIRYHQDIIGLHLSYRDEARAVLSTQQGLECVVLEPGDGPELAGLCFEISPRISLEDARAILGKSGITAEIGKGEAHPWLGCSRSRTRRARKSSCSMPSSSSLPIPESAE